CWTAMPFVRFNPCSAHPNCRDDVRRFHPAEIAMRLTQWIVCFLLGLPVAASINPDHAQGASYPDRQVRLVVPFPPGGGTDTTARMLAEKMSERLGQQMIVDNKPGANGLVGTDAVAKSAPDGYTVLMTDRGALGINPSLYDKLP